MMVVVGKLEGVVRKLKGVVRKLGVLVVVGKLPLGEVEEVKGVEEVRVAREMTRGLWCGCSGGGWRGGEGKGKSRGRDGIGGSGGGSSGRGGIRGRRVGFS